MYVTFPGYVRFGKLDGTDFEVDVELTDEEYERLKASRKTHWDMDEDDEIADIYDMAYSASLDMDIDVLRDDEDLLAEKMAWHLDISEEEASEREYTDEEIIEMLEAEGTRGINYPEDLDEPDDEDLD